MKTILSDSDTGLSGIYEMDGCLIVPIQEEIDNRKADELSSRVLGFLEQHALKLVLIDLSAVSVLDRKTFQVIHQTASMISLMGAETVFVGIQPGVASALVDLDVEIQGMQTAFSIREGINLLKEININDGYKIQSKIEVNEN